MIAFTALRSYRRLQAVVAFTTAVAFPASLAAQSSSGEAAVAAAADLREPVSTAVHPGGIDRQTWRDTKSHAAATPREHPCETTEADSVNAALIALHRQNATVFGFGIASGVALITDAAVLARGTTYVDVVRRDSLVKAGNQGGNVSPSKGTFAPDVASAIK